MAQNNVAGRAWPFASCSSLHALRAFTLAELLVSVSVLIILLGMVGVIYKSAAGAISQSNATTEIYQKAEALRRQLTEDLSSIRKDGILVVVGLGLPSPGQALYESAPGQTPTAQYKYRIDDTQPPVRSDQLLFWRTGTFRSYAEYAGAQVEGNVARILYSHATDILPADFGVGVGDDTTCNRWVLCRQRVISALGASGTELDSDPFQSGGNHPMGPVGRKYGQLDQLIDELNSFSGTVPAYLDDLEPDFTSDVGRYLFFDVGVGQFEIALITRTSGEVVVQSGQAIVCSDRPFIPTDPNVLKFGQVGTGLDEGHLWPLALRFTVRLYDRNLRVTSYDDDLGIEHGGLTFKFIIPLPD